jgi:hypothetical protein
MTSVARNTTLAGYLGVPDPWPDSPTLPESRHMDLPLFLRSKRQPTPPMRTKSKVPQLRLQTENLQALFPTTTQSDFLAGNEVASSAGEQLPIQPHLPIKRRGRPSPRLASSRRLTPTSNEHVSQQTGVSRPSPSPVPGELLERDSPSRILDGYDRGKSAVLGPVNERRTRPDPKYFRRWTHFGALSTNPISRDNSESLTLDGPRSPISRKEGNHFLRPPSALEYKSASARFPASKSGFGRFSAPAGPPIRPSRLSIGSQSDSSWVDLSPSTPSTPKKCSEKTEPEWYDQLSELFNVSKEKPNNYHSCSHIPSRDCTVCGDSKPEDQFPAGLITQSCTHKTNTCLRCIQKWIGTSIEEHGWDQSKCPECNIGLTHDDIHRLATPEVFKRLVSPWLKHFNLPREIAHAVEYRYDHLATRAALSAIPNFRWCQRPGCPSGQIHNGSADNNPIFTCTSCDYTYCINHPKPPFHFGETCAQFDLRQAGSRRTMMQILQDQKSERLVQKTSKRCPNAVCGWWIEKNDGCDHMTCARCKFEFCWLCCAAFEPIRRKGNRFHKSECKYYG